MNLILQAIAALSLLGATFAAELGDPAPALKIAKWVKGKPVEISPKGTYVVEFWATWCPPCRTSIPHLTEMQKRFKDVAFVGVTDEKENVVTPFVKNLDAKMDYRVAIDDQRQTSAGYMEAYGIGGIPHAFVVQNQKVVWQGHPMAGLDKALEEITTGKYDLAKAKNLLRINSLVDRFREAAAEGNDAEADRLAAELRAAAAQSDSPFKNFDAAREKRAIQSDSFKQQFQQAVFSGDSKQADAAAAKLKALDPDTDLDALRKEANTHKLAGSYLESLAEGGTPAKDAGQSLATALEGQPRLANEIAWQILTHPRIVHRDIPLASKIAKQACEDAKWQHAGAIDTYARALFDSGKKDEAIEIQEKAVAAAADEDEKAEYAKTLASYRQGKLPASE